MASEPVLTQRVRRPLVVEINALLHQPVSAEQFNLRMSLVARRPLQLLDRLVAPRRDRPARLTELEAGTLPYRSKLVRWLQEQRAQGQTLFLATAPEHSTVATRIAAHLGFFDAIVLQKDDGGFRNLRDGEFDCLGARCPGEVSVDDSMDGREAAAVGSGRGLMAWLEAVRPHQWVKNALVLIPLATSHLFVDHRKVALAVIAFVCFSLCASSAYVLNDLVDLQEDRRHRSKRQRPFASGRLSPAQGWLLWPVLLAVAFALALPLSPAFSATLAFYYLLTLGYSLYLKRKLMVDVVTLSVLYTTRLVAGAFAVDVPLSFWLATFSMFTFTSLALVKRYTELRVARADAAPSDFNSRGLSPPDLEVVSALGAAAGYAAVMVLALYVQDPATRHLYSHPNRIWPACPLLLYWFSRVWVLAHRGWINDDPVVFALRDRISFFVVVLIVGTFLLAR